MDVSRVTSGKITITAELWYQALSYPFIEDLRQDLPANDVTGLIARFMGLYDPAVNAPEYAPVMLDSDSVTVQVQKP